MALTPIMVATVAIMSKVISYILVTTAVSERALLHPQLHPQQFFCFQQVSKVARKEQSQYAMAGAVAEEVLSCIRTVIAFNGQKQECDRYSIVTKPLYSTLGILYRMFRRGCSSSEPARSCLFMNALFLNSRYQDALVEAKKTGILKAIFTSVGLSVIFFVIFSSYGLAFWYVQPALCIIRLVQLHVASQCHCIIVLQ